MRYVATITAAMCWAACGSPSTFREDTGASESDAAPGTDAPPPVDASSPDTAPAEDAQLDAAPVDAPDADVCGDCTTSDPCMVAACEDNECLISPAPNGSACGEDSTTICVDAACVMRGCGDGYREPGPTADNPDAVARESCDDGNNEPGDSCDPDCNTLLQVAVADPEGNYTPVASSPSPSIAVDGRGELFLVWREELGAMHRVVGRRFNRGGAPIGEPVVFDEAAPGNADPTVLGFRGGGWVVGHTVLTRFNGRDVRLRRVAADGTLGASRIAHDEVVLEQRAPYLALLSGDSFVVVYENPIRVSGDPSGSIWARRFTSSLSPIDAEEMKVNTSSLGVQARPRVAAIGDEWMVVFDDRPGLSEDATLRARRYMGGTPTDAQDFALGPHGVADVAAVGDELVVAYEDDGNIFAQRLTFADAPSALMPPLPMELEAELRATAPVVASLTPPDFLVLHALPSAAGIASTTLPAPEVDDLLMHLDNAEGGLGVAAGAEGVWFAWSGFPGGTEWIAISLFLLPY